MSRLRKLPECDQCLFNARSSYLVCSVHPEGVKSDRCLDFRLDSAIEQQTWAPARYSWYGGELIGSVKNLTESDRFNILEFHPLFTGRCPRCDHEYQETPTVHWDCKECDWKDDSV